MATIKGNSNSNGKPQLTRQQEADRKDQEAREQLQREQKEKDDRAAEIEQSIKDARAAEEADKISEAEEAELTEILAQVQKAPETPSEEIDPPADFVPEPIKELTFAERPITDRIEKIEFLYSLMDKLEKLKDTKNALAKFVLSSDGSRDSINLKDSAGNTFSTSQRHIFAEVLQLIKRRVDEMIKATENAIVI